MDKNENVIENIFGDDDFTDNVTLYDEADKPVEFQQIAVIYLDDDSYCILRPIEKITGLSENTGLVFKLDESGEEAQLVIITDEKTIDAVFDEYEKLYAEANKKD